MPPINATLNVIDGLGPHASRSASLCPGRDHWLGASANSAIGDTDARSATTGSRSQGCDGVANRKGSGSNFQDGAVGLGPPQQFHDRGGHAIP